MGKLKDTLIIDTDVCVDSSGTTAVDATYFWQPLETCPRGVKVQLLGKGGVAMYGIFNGRDEFYTHWAPLPKKPRVEMTDFEIQPVIWQEIELLKALKALVSSAERVSVGEYDEETLDINLSQARAAIKKATRGTT
jgi:hypothetical protein